MPFGDSCTLYGARHYVIECGRDATRELIFKVDPPLTIFDDFCFLSRKGQRDFLHESSPLRQSVRQIGQVDRQHDGGASRRCERARGAPGSG